MLDCWLLLALQMSVYIWFTFPKTMSFLFDRLLKYFLIIGDGYVGSCLPFWIVSLLFQSKDTVDSRSRGANNLGSRGGRSGSDRYSGRGGSSHYSSSGMIMDMLYCNFGLESACT